jgi:hypothetical protein
MNVVEDKNKQIKYLKEQLEVNLCEAEYNIRVIGLLKTALFQNFPTFTSFKGKNNGIKNVLINMKGYTAIKKNNLFDVGYYLKNNENIRLSGINPIIHYIYYGYKEGRTPTQN